MLDTAPVVNRIRAFLPPWEGSFGRGGPAMAEDRRGNLWALEFWGVGFVIVAGVVTGYLLGSWLDRKFGTSPWLVVAGVLLGTVAGILELFRTVSRSLK